MNAALRKASTGLILAAAIFASSTFGATDGVLGPDSEGKMKISLKVPTVISFLSENLSVVEGNHVTGRVCLKTNSPESYRVISPNITANVRPSGKCGSGNGYAFVSASLDKNDLQIYLAAEPD